MHHRFTPRRALFAAFLAALVALAIPAAASATMTSLVLANSVTFTGDAGNDNLVIDDNGTNLTHNQTGGTFNSPTDFDTAVGGDQTLPATDVVTVTVNAGDGQDSTLFNTTAVLSATLNGQNGDDVLSGTDGIDTLNGGADDDRLVGFRENDTMNGDAGNDTMVWNNGDGTDVMEGGANADLVEVNGSVNAGDVFTIAPGVVPGRVDFDRTNLGTFSLDIAAERIQVNGLAGDDTITSLTGAGPLIAHELNGGVGTDTITGSEANDLITGGDDVDTLNGGGSFDRIVGDRGNDIMGGDAGDDTLVWNNGDGTDQMNGGADTDRIEVNGNPGATDVFTIKPVTGGARFDRTNVGLFGLDITNAETLSVNALGGNDTLTADTGTPLNIVADGGDGDDVLSGADLADTLLGSAGNDTITGGTSRDLLDGGTGNDNLQARDGAEDLLRCGTGADTAVADLAGVDAADACETLDRPAVVPTVVTPPTATPAVVVVPPAGDIKALPALVQGGLTLARNQRSVALNLACPQAETGGCKVVLTLASANAVRIGNIRAVVLLGTVRANLRPGERRRVVVRLPNGLIRAINRRNRGWAIRATALTTDAAGNTAQSSRRLSLGGRRRR